MPEGFPGALELTNRDWPDGPKDDAPGNPAYFLPQGFTIGSPAVVFPYRGSAPDEYYGAQATRGDPITDSPLQDPSGGTLYFAANRHTILRVMGIRAEEQTYVAFASSAEQPRSERYLDQLKLVSHAALRAIFKIKAELPDEQSISVGEAISGFVAEQKNKWEDEWTFSRKLRGTAGGDGDWAKECLGFGLLVENTYWGVCRIWSRPYLVTK